MYFCKECKYKTDKKTDYSKHLNTIKHKKLGIAKVIEKWKPKKEYNCNLCFFESAYKMHYDRHLDSLKHIKNKEMEKQNQKDEKEESNKEKEEKRKAFAERRRLSIIENDKLQEEIISKSRVF
jgi:hypothetical protein